MSASVACRIAGGYQGAGAGSGAQPTVQLDGAVAERKDRVVVREAHLLVPSERRPHHLQHGTHAHHLRQPSGAQHRRQLRHLLELEPLAKELVRQQVLEALHDVRLRDEWHTVERGAFGHADAPAVASGRQAVLGQCPRAVGYARGRDANARLGTGGRVAKLLVEPLPHAERVRTHSPSSAVHPTPDAARMHKQVAPAAMQVDADRRAVVHLLGPWQSGAAARRLARRAGHVPWHDDVFVWREAPPILPQLPLQGTWLGKLVREFVEGGHAASEAGHQPKVRDVDRALRRAHGHGVHVAESLVARGKENMVCTAVPLPEERHAARRRGRPREGRACARSGHAGASAGSATQRSNWGRPLDRSCLVGSSGCRGTSLRPARSVPSRRASRARRCAALAAARWTRLLLLGTLRLHAETDAPRLRWCRWKGRRQSARRVRSPSRKRRHDTCTVPFCSRLCRSSSARLCHCVYSPSNRATQGSGSPAGPPISY
eukprot:scaffold8130_cov69-Phaeocystis_antarctica.AAC.7